MKKLLGRCLLRNTCPNTAQCRLGIVDIDRCHIARETDSQMQSQRQIDNRDDRYNR